MRRDLPASYETVPRDEVADHGRSLLALRSSIDGFLAEDDPRRFYIAQMLLYGGTFIVIAASLWLRHR